MWTMRLGLMLWKAVDWRLKYFSPSMRSRLYFVYL